MGCNVSKDGKEKNKKSENSSQRSSAKENGDGKGTADEKRSLVSDVINAQEQNESTTELDIDCDDPEVQQAATKIQAAFRGSQARKTLTEKMQQQSDKSDAPPLDEEIDANDPEVNQAAAKIQASFRGHMVRKDLKKQEDEKLRVPADTSLQRCEDDEIDIDLNDPNVEKAATKIQASFRGHLVRKQRNTPDDETA